MGMPARRIADLEVSALALGGALLGLRELPRDRALATVHAAVAAGITLFDTAAAYVPSAAAQGHGEDLFREALQELPGAIIATKGGHHRADGGFPVDGRPERIRADCESSLRALGRECIDLYFLHWPDPDVPVAESVGAMRDLRDEGKVRHLGLSNIDAAQLDEGLGVAPIAAVQNRFSPVASDSGLIERARELGIAFLAYSPVRGAADLAAVLKVAAARGCSPQQVILAWELAQSPNVIPIVGATRPETIIDSAGAAHLQLSAAELEALTAAVAQA